MNFIDAHSHVWTPTLDHFPLAKGFRKQDMDPPSFTAEELLKEMNAVGANRCVLIQMSFYGFDNSYMLDSMKRYPGKFSGVAVIDSNVPHPDEAMRRLKKLGVRGFRIRPQTKDVNQWLDSDGLKTMFKAGAAERLNMCCLINPDALPALDKFCEQNSETPVVIDHLCCIGETGLIEQADVKALCAMARHKHLTVKVSAFYALGKKSPPYHDLRPLIKQVYDAFGPQRLMWASDSPFQVVGGHTYKASIELIREGLEFLSKDDKDWLLTKTAERVFFR
jgi:predicted TIM-barrel fold metal-dependent hydrolase